MTPRHDPDRELERIARALHADAVAHVPGRTLLQLRSRRRSGVRAAASTPRTLAWGLGAAFAAVFAVAIGLRPEMRETGLPTSTVAVEPADALDDPVALDALQDPFVAFDEDPELYLWLASADAQPLAME